MSIVLPVVVLGSRGHLASRDEPLPNIDDMAFAVAPPALHLHRRPERQQPRRGPAPRPVAEPLRKAPEQLRAAPTRRPSSTLATTDGSVGAGSSARAVADVAFVGGVSADVGGIFHQSHLPRPFPSPVRTADKSHTVPGFTRRTLNRTRRSGASDRTVIPSGCLTDDSRVGNGIRIAPRTARQRCNRRAHHGATLRSC